MVLSGQRVVREALCEGCSRGIERGLEDAERSDMLPEFMLLFDAAVKGTFPGLMEPVRSFIGVSVERRVEDLVLTVGSAREKDEQEDGER